MDALITLAKSDRLTVEAKVDLPARRIILKFNGALDEKTDLRPVSNYVFGLHSDVRIIAFDVLGVTDINSTGVRTWVSFTERLALVGPAQKTPYQFVFLSISEVFLERANYFTTMFGPNSTIESFEAPFRCPQCKTRTTELITSAKVDFGGEEPTLSPPGCKSCGKKMQFDEIASTYFKFLKRH